MMNLREVHSVATQFALVVLVASSHVCSAQVNVIVAGIDGNTQIDASQYTTTLITCVYEADPGHTINILEGMQWKRGDTDPEEVVIGSIDNAGSATYSPPFNVPAYVITSADVNRGCNLTIQNVSQADMKQYSCIVFVQDPTSRSYQGTATLLVHSEVKPETIQLTGEDGKSLNDNAIVTLDPKVASYSFTCTVPGIYPGVASFKWTIGDNVLTGLRLPDIVDGAGLRTSSSNVTLDLKSADEKRLKCQAMDQDGIVDATISVIIDLTSVASTTPTPGISPTDDSTTPTGQKGDECPAGCIAGICAGAVGIGCCAAAGGVYFGMRNKEQRDKKKGSHATGTDVEGNNDETNHLDDEKNVNK